MIIKKKSSKGNQSSQLHLLVCLSSIPYHTLFAASLDQHNFTNHLKSQNKRKPSSKTPKILSKAPPMSCSPVHPRTAVATTPKRGNCRVSASRGSWASWACWRTCYCLINKGIFTNLWVTRDWNWLAWIARYEIWLILGLLLLFCMMYMTL